MTDKTNETFTATFTLSQEGPDGDVTSTLEFNPLIDRANADEAPLAYEMMAFLAQHYLYMIGVVDENGELIDPEAFSRNTQLNVTTLPVDKSKLN